MVFVMGLHVVYAHNSLHCSVGVRGRHPAASCPQQQPLTVGFATDLILPACLLS
jgi:hypothetical protein